MPLSEIAPSSNPSDLSVDFGFSAAFLNGY